MDELKSIETLESLEPLYPLEPLDPLYPLEPLEPLYPLELLEPLYPLELLEPLYPLEPLELEEPEYWGRAEATPVRAAIAIKDVENMIKVTIRYNQKECGRERAVD